MATRPDSVISATGGEQTLPSSLLILQNTVLEAIAKGRPLDEVLNLLCLQAEQAVGDCLASVMLFDETGTALDIAAAPSMPPEAVSDFSGLKPGPGAGSCGNAVYSGKQTFVCDVPKDQRWRDIDSLAVKYSIGACWSFPVFLKSKAEGSFAITRFTRGEPDFFHQQLLQTGAYLAGLAVERARSAKALDQSNARLKTFTGAMPDLGFILSTSGEYLEIYGEPTALLYANADSIRGRKLSDVLPAEPAAIIMSTIKRVLDTQQPEVVEFELDVLAGRRVFEGRVAALTTGSEPATEVVWISRDITERRDAEAERQKLQQQLIQSQKLEAVGHLAGGIAHDFNNILASILGYTGLAIDQFASADPSLARYLGEVRHAGERAKALIAQLLAFSRHDMSNASAHDLAPLVERAIAMLRPTLPASIRITVEIEDELPPVIVDPVKLDQVIVNLCINSRDAVAGKGWIAVGLNRPATHSAVCASCHQDFDGDYVELSVSDSGPGIEAETGPRIFDPFFTTKPVGQGSGMGLAVIHGIVHDLGGHILAGTAEKGGAVFRILMPPAPAATSDREVPLDDSDNPS